MKNLFLDFDGTIVNSIKAYCTTYNIRYNFGTDADWTKVRKYNFIDQCPLVDNPQDIFESAYFFYKLNFINHNTQSIIKELSKHYKITIVTIGTLQNLALKSGWIQEKLSFIDDVILIKNKDCTMNKEIVNMASEEGSIFIDDVSSNLFSSNANVKICFGNKYEWNEDWTGERCSNWLEVGKRLLGDHYGI
jgi:5'(3')-deoxyribonucleotidase